MPTPPTNAMHQRLRDMHADMFGLAHHADWYDRIATRAAQPLYRRVVADVTARGLPAGAVVLDIGTGPGRVPLLLAERRPDWAVEGIDLAPEMVARANANAATHRSAHPRYRVGDVAHLPHADASVDLVVSTLSLHHWVDPVAGLTEIRRVLRPGATAWIYDARAVLQRAASRAAAAGHRHVGRAHRPEPQAQRTGRAPPRRPRRPPRRPAAYQRPMGRFHIGTALVAGRPGSPSVCRRGLCGERWFRPDTPG